MIAYIINMTMIAYIIKTVYYDGIYYKSLVMIAYIINMCCTMIAYIINMCTYIAYIIKTVYYGCKL